MTLTSCELLSTEKITITPTIPIRKHPDRGTPKIMFLMPPDINLVDAKSSCKISLQEGMKSTEIRIKAACKTSGVTEGQQIIIPKLLTKHFERWGHKTARLPKIMVCIYCYSMNDGLKIIFIVPMTNTTKHRYGQTNKNCFIIVLGCAVI